jgi:GNAT superfamily N-acetyltransferase
MVLRYREASVPDIGNLKKVRISVRENRLSDPARISDAEYEKYLSEKGKGWVCLDGDDEMAGFSVIDLVGNNVWALFVRPEYEGNGIGRRLHDLMLDWYFSQTTSPVWLSTEPGSRAEKFYREAGWEHIGNYGEKELKFQMTINTWRKNAEAVKNSWS